MEVNVNSKMTNEQRRVDFRNMIYIADGPSDVPAFLLSRVREVPHLQYILKVIRMLLSRLSV